MDKYLKRRKVSFRFQKDIEPQEILLDRLAQEKEDETKSKLETPLPEMKFLIFGGIFLILFLILLGRTFQLQLLEGSKFLDFAKANKENVFQTQPERGTIYDRNARQLVWNQPAFDLVCYKKDLPKEDDEITKTVEELAKILGKDPQILFENIRDSETREVLIAENLSHQILVNLEPKIKNLPGFQIKPNLVRDYLDPVISHLMGYARKVTLDDLKNNPDYSVTDQIGGAGLEKSYEKVLRGSPEKILIERDALGQKQSERIISQPEPGKSLVLSLDFELQKKIAEELEQSLKRVGAEAGAAIALDPNTGEVLSLVSLPNFNNDLFSQGFPPEDWEILKKDPSRPLFNRAISGIGYPTGSVIKPLIAIAALEEDIITEQTKINCPAQICVWNPYAKKDECYKDWTFPEAHGTSDVKRAIAESINPFFYTIGGGYKNFEGLGARKIKEYLELFDWGTRSGIDLPEEGQGILPKIDENWRLGDTYHISIGQGPFTATPLEVGVAFSAIANGGKLYRPFLVKKIVDSSDPSQIIEETQLQLIKENFVSSQNIEIVREGMRQAVTSGSATLLNNLPVKVAAKTGTAESSLEDYYHHWVTVFAPYENPQIVLTVVIENVRGIQAATLPVAKNVLEWYFEARPQVYLSSNSLEQGETLLIKIPKCAGLLEVKGKINGKGVDFLKSAAKEEWVGIVGIDARAKAGEYKLVLDFSFSNDRRVLKELEFEVKKRDFPVTELVVTKELEEKGYSPSKIIEEIATKENLALKEVLDVYTPEAYFDQAFFYPLKRIKDVGVFGNIRKSGDFAAQHLGVDLEAEAGTPVQAINDGQVRFAENLYIYGKTLIIDHGFGIFSLYLHLSDFKVSEGDQVKRGEIVGGSGNTGYSITPHLHFSVRVNGATVDPLRFIDTVERELK